MKDRFLLLCEAANLVLPETEFKFWPGRRFRFDYAWLEYKIAVEIEGGVFIRGRHSRGVGMINDMIKYNYAAMTGWIVLRYTPQNMGQAIEDLKGLWKRGSIAT